MFDSVRYPGLLLRPPVLYYTVLLAVFRIISVSNILFDVKGFTPYLLTQIFAGGHCFSALVQATVPAITLNSFPNRTTPTSSSCSITNAVFTLLLSSM